MNRFIKHLVLIAFLGMKCAAAESLVQPNGPSPASLFDVWGKGEDGGGRMKEFRTWVSPTQQYKISFLKADRDLDAFILTGKASSGGKDLLLGRGLYGVDVTWKSTRIGDVAIVDHKVSGGFNEVFVVKPTTVGDWRLLYRTPRTLAPDGLVMEQCYWSVVSLDGEVGLLGLKAAWSFSNVSNLTRKATVTEASYNIPIFYGFRTAVPGVSGLKP